MILASADFWIAIVVFVTTCAGLGYLAGTLARRRAWPRAVWILMSAAIASIWPALLMGFALQGASAYQRVRESDPGDAPAYVLMGSIFGGGILFVLGLPLALVCAYLAYRRGQTPQPNVLSR
jgi:hypothetical protein